MDSFGVAAVNCTQPRTMREEGPSPLLTARCQHISPSPTLALFCRGGQCCPASAKLQGAWQGLLVVELFNILMSPFFTSSTGPTGKQGRQLVKWQ